MCTAFESKTNFPTKTIKYIVSYRVLCFKVFFGSELISFSDLSFLEVATGNQMKCYLE